MKPFAHWAIQHQQKIRIAGRDRAEIWGALASPDGAVRPFRYAQQTMRLAIGEGEDRRVLQLDAYGFEQPLPDTDLPTNA
ncbi:MAG TPA: hypothetical protein VL334_22445 [Anaerolineae bacterium]|nr:hypothetical protein [Anaerolineae bacterium]